MVPPQSRDRFYRRHMAEASPYLGLSAMGESYRAAAKLRDSLAYHAGLEPALHRFGDEPLSRWLNGMW